MTTYIIKLEVVPVGAPLQPSGAPQPDLYASEPFELHDDIDLRVAAPKLRAIAYGLIDRMLPT